jgi:hypothetical protein
MASAKRLLFVREAPIHDQMNLCVLMSVHDRPDGLKSGDWVKLRFIDSGKSVVCRLEVDGGPSASVRLKRIHINSHLREMLGIPWDKVAPYRLQEFRIEKASSWGFFWYIHRYHPDNKKRVEAFLGLTLQIGCIVSIILGFAGTIIAYILQ